MCAIGKDEFHGPRMLIGIWVKGDSDERDTRKARLHRNRRDVKIRE